MAFKRRASATLALASTAALLLAACSSTEGDEGSSSSADGDVTLTWWHNGTADPLLTYWTDVAADFSASHDGVTVEPEAVQNEDFDTRIAVAFQSGDAPDVFQQWGGGQMQEQVDAGYVMDVTDLAADTIASLGGAVSPWQYDGKTYGIPTGFGIEGVWYRKSLFEEAGITDEPTTMDELYDVIDQLKAADITPIAVGAADQWPAAHWWYNFALRECPQDVLVTSATSHAVDDACYVKAGDDLQELIDAEPFQEGYAGTTAQQGATSSAGLLANGKAAMELMGYWDAFVLTGLVEEDQQDALTADLGWFPFPAVEGGEGDPDAQLGGGDGFSCSVDAPDVCAEFLAYIASDEVQQGYASVVGAMPVNPNAADSVTNPVLAEQVPYVSDAPYVQLWLDTTFGSTVGNAMNSAIASMFSGGASAQDIVDDMADAAATE